ncbi:MAG: M20 family metallopeptidase [Streptomycetales bacterium]
MNRQQEAVTEYIDARRDELVELMQTMIRTRSINPAFDPDSPGEAAMAELVKSRYEGIGIPVETVEAVPGRPNLIATWKGTTSTPRLLVNAHLDTHPADLGEWFDPFTAELRTEWSVDPFGGEIRDGKIYGRGAADHKSPIAAILFALEALGAAGVRLRGDVTCIHDVDEETGGEYGMQHLSERLPFDYDMALYACTSEFSPLGREFFPAMGTDNIIRSFSGWQTYRIHVVGQNLHNISPKRGYGAVEAALFLLDRLRPLIDKVNAYVDPVEGQGQSPMRVSGIDCAPRGAFHHQARWAEITVNRRIPPSLKQDQARMEVQQVLAAHNAAYPENQATLAVVRDMQPYGVPDDHPLVTGLSAAVRDMTGAEPTVAGVPSPVGISTMLGKHAIPTVLFGYGVLNLHHAIDEHIECDALVKTAKVYAAALMEWLGVAES